MLIIILMLLFTQCRGQSQDSTNLEWRQYQDSICLNIFKGEIVLPALGHGRICGHPTPNCNQAYCSSCAAQLGVCEVCGKKNNWTKNTTPKTEIPLLFAILKHSDNLAARRVAIYALGQIKESGTLEKLMKYSGDKMLSFQLAMAIGEFKDSKYMDYLKNVLQSASNNYFGNENQDTETQYYLANAARGAAQSLAKIGNRKAIDILLRSARYGRLWERSQAIDALANFNDKRVKATLETCLKEFFAKDRDWKWIPGRDLIGTTLRSLAKNGDKETAFLLIQYIRNPGCDFLYEDLRMCLSQIGKPAVPEIIVAIKEDLKKNLYDYGRIILIESLRDISDYQAVPFFIEMLDWTYPDEYLERDFKRAAIQGLGKLKAKEALNKIETELLYGKEEWTRQIAAQSLGQIGGLQAFIALENKLKQSDSEWVIKECLTSLNAIAFNEIKTDEIRLKAIRITAQKSGFETAFQLIYQPVLDGEEWAIDYCFEILGHISMQQNLYRIIMFLDSQNKKAFDKTLSFLNRLTKLQIKTNFNDSPEKKNEVKQKFNSWYQQHYQELK